MSPTAHPKLDPVLGLPPLGPVFGAFPFPSPPSLRAPPSLLWTLPPTISPILRGLGTYLKHFIQLFSSSFLGIFGNFESHFARARNLFLLEGWDVTMLEAELRRGVSTKALKLNRCLYSFSPLAPPLAPSMEFPAFVGESNKVKRDREEHWNDQRSPSPRSVISAARGAAAPAQSSP